MILFWIGIGLGSGLTLEYVIQESVSKANDAQSIWNISSTV